MKHIEIFRKITLYRAAALRALDLEERLYSAGNNDAGERAGRLYDHFSGAEDAMLSGYRAQYHAERLCSPAVDRYQIAHVRRLAERLYKKYQH